MLQGAEDFRQAKRQKTGTTKPEEAPGKKKRGIAFGTGALEDTDTFGYMDDYTSNDRHNLASFSYEVASDEEDTDLPGRYGSAVCTYDAATGQCLEVLVVLPLHMMPTHLVLACSAVDKALHRLRMPADLHLGIYIWWLPQQRKCGKLLRLAVRCGYCKMEMHCKRGEMLRTCAM